ncbi:MAG: FAD-binding oxidoreductase [Phycisphaerales bacterium]
MSVSHWKRSPNPTLAEPCDVVVIGAGITGLTAAYEFADRGLSVTILERHTLGWGASSRNAGFLMRGVAESYAHCCDALSRETASRVWRWSEENLKLLRDRYRIADLDSYQAIPSSIVAMSESEAEELRNSANMLEYDGFECTLQTSGRDTLWTNIKPEIALVNPNDAAINPWDLVNRLKDTLVHAHSDKVTLIENAEVTQFDPNGHPLTRSHIIPCDSVLVCTNAWASELLPSLGALIEPTRGQMLALRAEEVTLDASYYLNRGSEYIRQTRDGTIILGGMRTLRESEEQTSSDATTHALQSALDDYARYVLKTEIEVVARWAGTMGFSPTGLPVIAKADEHPGKIWFCGGLTGHGMSLGARTAQAAVQCMQTNEPSPFPVS